MTDEYEYFVNKRVDKTYIRPTLALTDEPDRKIRIASKVMDSPESHSFALDRGGYVVRVTEGGRQEVVAKFYEDDRSIATLTIQRFTKDTGKPHTKTSFSFHDKEISTLLEFLNNIRLVDLPDDRLVNVTDEELQELLLSDQQVRAVMMRNQDALIEIARSEITKSDLIALGYRKKQLERFGNLLSDTDYFAGERAEVSRDEDVWQRFFETNPWVFGYGLTFVHLSNLDDRRLEQIVAGATFAHGGKRADALMKTKGAIEALCFVEIKKHTTGLLNTAAPYRSGCWAPSAELVGGIAQVQGTVEQALRDLEHKIEPIDSQGNPTGETMFAYQPKSFLVVGSLSEFRSANGTNVQKYRSFELFRRSIAQPEIITFDELYDRARFIVEQAER